MRLVISDERMVRYFMAMGAQPIAVADPLRLGHCSAAEALALPVAHPGTPV